MIIILLQDYSSYENLQKNKSDRCNIYYHIMILIKKYYQILLMAFLVLIQMVTLKIQIN